MDKENPKIVLHKNVFPYSLRGEDSKETVNVTLVHQLPYDSFRDDHTIAKKTLFILKDVSTNFNFNDNTEDSLSSSELYVTDDSKKKTKVFHLAFVGINGLSHVKNVVKCKGWLTEIRMFSPAQDIINTEKLGYFDLPEVTRVEGLALPTPVIIETFYGTSEELDKFFNQSVEFLS